MLGWIDIAGSSDSSHPSLLSPGRGFGSSLDEVGFSWLNFNESLVSSSRFDFISSSPESLLTIELRLSLAVEDCPAMRIDLIRELTSA